MAKIYYFVRYDIEARGAFSSCSEAQEWASRMEPLSINGETVFPEVVPMEASEEEGIVLATRWYAEVPLGRVILYENEKLKEKE